MTNCVYVGTSASKWSVSELETIQEGEPPPDNVPKFSIGRKTTATTQGASVGRKTTLASASLRPTRGMSVTELVVAIHKQHKVQKAQGDPEAIKKIMDDENEGKCMRCLEVFGKMGLNHILIYVVLLLYAFLGAAIFEATEESNEIATREARLQHLNDSVLNLTQRILDLDASRDRENDIRRLLRAYQEEENLFPTHRRYWDFWGALFFAGTLFTTIGYGHYCPVTRWGKVATMLYAVVGIPLVLALLSDLGKLLTKFFKRLYSEFRKLKKCRERKRWAATEGDTDSYLHWIESDDLDVPIPVAILIFFGWILLCSLIFCIWETEWDFFTAFYFFFISLTTIGLGDVTPDHPRYMIFGCGFVIVGLSLISMVINLIQIKMEKLKEATADYLEEELGWDTESSSGEEEEGEEEEQRPHSLGIFSTGMVQKSPSQSTLPKSGAASAMFTKNKALAETWKKKAKVDDLRMKKRRRRGAQTDYSYLREMSRKYPHLTYLQIPDELLYKSRDDVNSLLETLE